MKPQDKSAVRVRFSACVLRQLRDGYRGLGRAVGACPCLAQGSVNVVAPKSPSARLTYTWTRKVRAKTVTVALSERQAAAFRQAITANQRVEEALARLRHVSQSALLAEVPGVTKRRSRTAPPEGATPVQKGA